MRNSSVLLAALVLFAAAYTRVADAKLYLDFINDGTEDCDPIESLFNDPRARGMQQLLDATGLRDLYEEAWLKSGGTVLIPSTDAWDDLLEQIGVTELANITDTISRNVWNSVVPSYFLNNVTYLPKDVGDRFFQTPPGWIVFAGMYRSNLTDQTSLIMSYSKLFMDPFLRPVRHENFGQPATVIDWSLVCDMYAVYWTDKVLLPEDDPCDLSKNKCNKEEPGQDINTAGRRLVEAQSRTEALYELSHNAWEPLLMDKGLQL